MIDFNLAPRQLNQQNQQKNSYIAFAENMLSYGLKAGEIIADGYLHRFDVSKPGDRASVGASVWNSVGGVS